MTTELWVLMGGTALLATAILMQGIAGLIAYGPLVQAGPRDQIREPTKLLGRAGRTVQNQLESLALFGVVVLVGQIGGAQSALSEQGAILYLIARSLYLPVYWGGVPFIRTIIFTAGLVGTAMVAWPVFSA